MGEHWLPSDAQRQPTISYQALYRANNTISDFARMYLPLLGLKYPEDFVKHLDVLVFVECTIYQLDEENEQTVKRGNAPLDMHLPLMDTLLDVLEHLKLLDERVLSELTSGINYWRLERKLCSAMALLPAWQGGMPAAVDVAEVMAAHEAKSFDYRVLHLLLHRLAGRADYDESVLAFFRLDEMLVDIGDDLTDYEDDVEANSFNIYRCFVHLHGPGAALALAKRIGELEAAHAAALQRLPAAVREHYLSRQTEAYEEPGAEKWCFPSPILDEAAFRRDVCGQT